MAKRNWLLVNGSKLHISHIGNSKFLSNHFDKSLRLNNILHVPHITKNLVSISKCTTDNSVSVEFTPSCCYVKDLITGATLLKGVHDLVLHVFIIKIASFTLLWLVMFPFQINHMTVVILLLFFG